MNRPIADTTASDTNNRTTARNAAALSLSAACILAAGGCSSDFLKSSELPQKPSPFQQEARRTAQFENAGETSIFPARYTQQSPPRRGLSSSPQFRMFGELPNTHADRNTSRIPYDTNENAKQISYTTIGEDFDPVISRNGETIFFASTQHRPTADIYSKSVGGRALTQLTNDPAHDVMPALSPDGKRLAFASNRNGSWDIYIMAVDGGQPVQVTSDAAHELSPSWSPDGQALVYSRMSPNADRWEIWTTDLQQREARQFLTYGLFPEWHPIEDKIIFQRARDRANRFFSIWTVEYNGEEASRPTEVAASNVAALVNPSWSPDGRFLAFSAVFNPTEKQFGERPDFADVWIMEASGKAKTNLTGGWYVNLSPTWGPDNEVFFVSDRNGHDNVWSIGSDQAIYAAGLEQETDLATVEEEDEQ